MKKAYYRKNRIYKRIISFILVIVLVLIGIPIDFIGEDIVEYSESIVKVKAEGELDALKEKYTGNSHTFTSGMPDLSEYSQCFQDATWAAEHDHDTITLNPRDSKYIFDTNYNPIGNASAPFYGTIYLNTGTDDFYIEANSPIFDYVKDSAKLYKLGTTNVIPLNINRVADAGDSVSPLLAKHMVGSDATDSYEWKVTLNSSNVKSYSGVIYEMTGGAKVNLTFVDNSSHAPARNTDNEIISGSIIDNKEINTNYGILCGYVKGSSVLQCTYTKTNDDEVTFIGTESAYCGGLIGEINNSTFELLSGSSALKLDFQTAKSQVGFICGHAEESTITLPDAYSIAGSIDGTEYAGGIAGYCKNTVVSYETSTGTIALSDCVIKNGTKTGGVFGYYESNTYANDILVSKKYSLTDCAIEGTAFNGGIAGEYNPQYNNAVTIDLDNYSFDNISLATGTSAGGLFGKYTARGNVTITDSDTTNSHFVPPSSTVAYGGVIGEYYNTAYTNTLTLSSFTVNSLTVNVASNDKNVGGIIRTLTGDTYISVNDVSVTNVTADNASYFGGIIATLNNSNNNGSFIDVTGNYTLSMASGKTYKGGAIAGSFKKGVIRFAGTTDISGAQAESGYAQLVYENDETLVYAKGNGSDSAWTFRRNVSTTASDLGQWGEVVRMFTVDNEEKNAEAAGIVSADDTNHTVTVASVTANPTVTDEVSFAKVALNMQLNDGGNHGPLCFATGGVAKSVLLSSDITVSGTIDLADTGLLGLMCDIKTNDIFTGKIIGDAGKTNKITLAVGDSYGVGAGGSIYLSHGNSDNGHNAQGLLAYSQSANVSNLTVDGTMNIDRLGIGNSLYAGAVSGYVTGGLSLNTVTANPVINFISTKSDQNVYIGGVAGIYDDNKAATGFTVSGSSITPTINISGNNALATAHHYGGVLGYLNGSNGTAYDFTIENSTLTPVITIANGCAQQSEAYIGGLIAMIGNSKQQTITIHNTNITNANISTKSLYAGGLLGHRWENVNVSIDGLSITGSAVSNTYSNAANNGGLVFASHGVWDVESISIDSTSSFTTSSGNSFGLLVNEGYRSADKNNNGLYLMVKNIGLNYAGGITVTEAVNMDEICVKTADNADKVVSGGDSVGVISIDMNAGTNTKTKVTETGTYQNKITAFANKNPNSLSRYYYGLQLMKEKAEASGGEQFLLWSVRKYASSNIKNMFKDSDDMIASTDIDLSGLSYYPIALDSVTLPNNATVTFGFNDVKAAESNSIFNTDNYSRNPDDTGNARNQHYLMQTGLFTTVSSLSANTLTLTGDFGYVSGAASGALINKSTSGTVSLSGLTLDNLRPSSNASYMLINSIDGTGDATPRLILSNLRANNYSSGLPVAKSLFGTATGQNMTMNFSDIKLDARDDSSIADTNWTPAAASVMDTAYGTSRSIFSTAIFFESLLAAKSSTIEYYYTVEEDWGTGTPRNVTYGKEVTDSKEYANGEKHYNIVGDSTGHFTNPISDSNTEFDFTAGFLPYVGNYTSNGTNVNYPVNEIKVNYKVAGLVEGCGTYNDPYVITTASQLNVVADAINNGVFPATIKLPNTMSTTSSLPFAATWHTGTNGDGLYNLSGSNYVKDTTNSSGLTTWTSALVRNYLASAYYVIKADLTGENNSLPSNFEGIGKPGNTVNGNVVFHGVIVGKKSDGSAPTITNPSQNPLIYISNGSVVKNLNIEVTANISRSLDRVGNNALYGYKPNDSTNKGAEYYGGVIGEIMGGDNIIDDVSVTYSGTTTLSSDTAKHLIAEGGMVGCVVNGALIFRGSNSVTRRSVTGGGIYSNQYVGRVINGYAVYESISGRTGTAPDNYNKIETDEDENVTKTYTYHIDTIDRSKTTNSANLLDVNYNAGTITVPDAQSLYILSLITQSIASTANNDANTQYGAYSPSYGYNNYITGVARLGDYSSVGCGTGAEQPNDYSSYASLDSVNNYTNSSSKDGLMKAPVPYIIYRYTERKSTTATNPAADFPARKMTSDNTKFWDITLSSSNTFASMDSFQAFRGIGCVGINAYSEKNVTAPKTAFKVATFDGGNNTLKLYISLPRYERNKENYFHLQNKSLTQVYSGDDLNSANYGHDEQLWQLHGLGLFDCVIVKNDNEHEYQFQNITLQGIVEDKVYNSNGENVTGKNDQTQLFCVGGVIGKRVTYGGKSDTDSSYATDNNFKNITFDGLSIIGAYSCGGLVGIDACKSAKAMRIDGCNSTTNGISVTGGYYGKEKDKLRHGIGSFVGMTFWCRPYIDGKTTTNDTSEIRVLNVSSFYDGDYMSSVGGLIGYSGSGAEIKNINLIAANASAVIGGTKVSNAAGFVGFTQSMTSNSGTRNEPNEKDLKDCVYIENCTIQNLPIMAKNGAGGFVSKTGNSDAWHTKYIYISDCAVIGNSESKPEIKAYGTGTTTQTNYAGGFVGDLRSSVVTCLIQNSYIEDYTIEGWHVGGIIGETTYRSVNLRNLYVKDCEIIRNNKSSGSIGGIVGYSNQNLNGYNLKIDNVAFKKKSDSGYTESPSDAGFILGENSANTLIDKFIGIGAYHSDDSKVPSSVVKTNGTGSSNFFVFADYLNASETDLINGTGSSSTFGVTDGNSVESYPEAPYVNTAPHMVLGNGAYITGDGAGMGATLGNAGEIYKDYKAGTSNRRYSVGTGAVTDSSVANVTDAVTIAKYINNDGTYNNGTFKISTAAAEFGEMFTNLNFDNFAILVINNDTDKSSDITPFIKSYIRLVTNAAASANSNTFLQAAYSCGSTEIDKLYQIEISPCYYNSNSGKFVLGTAGAQGLQMYSKNGSDAGKYWFDSTKADSESGNTCQFSLIDVQFKDPTDTTYTKVAYHLYVPVYTKKMLTAEFSAVSMSATTYNRSPYAIKTSSEITGGKDAIDNPSTLVESTNEWTTTFIRYTYPKDQITSADNWNFDKSIILKLDSNFDTLPNGTKLILVDPNANLDKYYMFTLDGTYDLGTNISIPLSSFRDERNNQFAPINLSSILADQGAWGTGEGHTNELYEDYYISIYVPNVTNGQTHGVRIDSGTLMTHTSGGDVKKANIDRKLASYLVLGDLFNHSIVNNGFTVTSGDGDLQWDDNREMTYVNKVLKTDVIATVQIKNLMAGSYLSNSDVYHAFYLTLTSYDANNKVSDIINGINPVDVRNKTTLSYTDSGGSHTEEVTNSFLGANYVYLNSGSIRDALMDPTLTPTITIHSVTTMTFYDYTAFPYNISENEKIGTQVSVKSSLAYREEDLRFSALNSVAEDPDSFRYYSTDQNSAQLSFNAVPTDDATDEIGLKTNNRSLLGVNGKYGTQHPVVGKAIYNVDDIVDYTSAENVVYTITLWKKVTDGTGTKYVQVNNISNYLSDVSLTDSNSEVNLIADTTDVRKYVYIGKITHGSQIDLDKMFEVDFSCVVLTGDSDHNKYANYRIVLTADLDGASNALKDAYLVYTNAKFDPSVIDE